MVNYVLIFILYDYCFIIIIVYYTDNTDIDNPYIYLFIIINYLLFKLLL